MQNIFQKISKNKKIFFASVIATILVALLVVYLLASSRLSLLNSYKPQIEKLVKDQTGLILSAENVGFKINLNLSADIFADGAKLSYPDKSYGNATTKPILQAKSLSVKLDLLPLLIKKLEIKGVQVQNFVVNLSRDSNGRFSVEKIIEDIQNKQIQSPKTSKKEGFQLVKSLNFKLIELKNYDINLEDNMSKPSRTFRLAGDLAKVADFNPEKQIKIQTSGKFYIQKNPNINFNIKLHSELPLDILAEQPSSSAKLEEDFLEQLVKYDFKTSVNADLKLKNSRKKNPKKDNHSKTESSSLPDIEGFLDIEDFSIKYNGKIIPKSYAKLNFDGKTIKTDSKIFITPESYLSVAGNIKDLEKRKLDLAVSSTEIDLKELKFFLDSTLNSLNMGSELVNSTDISGKLKANFKISDNESYSGYLTISNANISNEGVSKPLKNINSMLKFEDNRVILKDTAAYFDTNKITVFGFIDAKNNADIKITATPLYLKPLLDAFNKSPLLKKNLKDLKPQIENIQSLSGAINLETTLKGKLDAKKSVFSETKISLLNPSITHKQMGFPVSFPKGSILIRGKSFDIANLHLNLGTGENSGVIISGKIEDYTEKTPKPDLNIAITNFGFSNIKALSNSPLLENDLKTIIKSITSPSGFVSGNIKALPDQSVLANLSLNSISAIYSPTSLPVGISSGMIQTDGKKLDIKNLNLRLSNSIFQVSGAAAPLDKTKKLPEINISAKGSVKASDIKKYSSPEVRNSIKAAGDIPLNANLLGNVENWKLSLKANIDNLAYLATINNRGSKVLNLNIKGNKNTLGIENSGLSLTSAENPIYPIAFSGNISNYSTKNPLLSNFKVNLSSLDLSTNEPKGRMLISGNALISGSVNNPKATGNISINNLSVPSMKLASNNISVNFNNSNISMNSELLKIADSRIKFALSAQNSFKQPFIVNSMSVYSGYLNLDNLQKEFPPSPIPQNTPIIVKSGSFKADSMIVNSLKTTNVACNFSINPMNMLNISNFNALAAGGQASGKIFMNLKTSRISAYITTKNMEVNTLATAFANMPNEIYGPMDGKIDISTYGNTPEQTMNNAKGNVSFSITEGRLVKLGSISHLLKAGNVLSGGVGLQLIENVLRFREASNSSNFRKITGDIDLSNGIMLINELSSQGSDMSMLTRGTVKMSNNYSELTVLGVLSERITSKLGSIPQFSIDKTIDNAINKNVDKLIKKIPAQWGQIVSEGAPEQIQKPILKRTAAKNPYLNRIPPLAGGKSETDRYFEAKIQGNYFRPTSVRSFKFLDSSAY